MRRVMILVVSVLTIVTMAVSPAFADDRDGDGWDEDFGFWIFVPVFIVLDADFDGVDDNFDCDFIFCDDFDFNDDFFFFGDSVIEEIEFEDGVLEEVEFEEV